jgi:hypothetical protein
LPIAAVILPSDCLMTESAQMRRRARGGARRQNPRSFYGGIN